MPGLSMTHPPTEDSQYHYYLAASQPCRGFSVVFEGDRCAGTYFFKCD